jgi:hypothetical protein
LDKRIKSNLFPVGVVLGASPNDIVSVLANILKGRLLRLYPC